MSVETLAVVLHHSRARGTAKLVLVGIANHDGDGGAWPALSTLARYANVDERNVRRALGQLIELGELQRDVQAGGTATSHAHDSDRPNLYRVLVRCPQGCEGGRHHRPRHGYRRQDDGSYTPVDKGGANPPGGGASDTPGGGASAPLTEPSNPVAKAGASVTGSREAGSTPPCTTCSAPDLTECSRRQAKLRSEDRHTYSPRPWA